MIMNPTIHAGFRPVNQASALRASVAEPDVRARLSDSIIDLLKNPHRHASFSGAWNHAIDKKSRQIK
jgi:hypothetical protein